MLQLTCVLHCAGKVRQRSQALRSIIGQRRDADGTIMANQAPHKGACPNDNICAIGKVLTNAGNPMTLNDP